MASPKIPQEPKVCEKCKYEGHLLGICLYKPVGGEIKILHYKLECPKCGHQMIYSLPTDFDKIPEI